MYSFIEVGVDIHSINVAGVSIPMGYALMFCFIFLLFWIIYMLAKYLFLPFMKKKWESVEKVGELLPKFGTLILQNDENRKAFDTLNHSVRTDLIHEMKDMKNSISGIMVMVKESQEDNHTLAIAHHKLKTSHDLHVANTDKSIDDFRTKHDLHVSNTDKSLTEIRMSVKQILQLMPKETE